MAYWGKPLRRASERQRPWPMTGINRIAEEAARWHARAERLSPNDERRLDAWLAADVRHRLAYADVAAAGFALEQAAPARVQRRPTRRWPLWVAATAAPTLLLFVVLAMPQLWQDWHSDLYTSTGAFQRQVLVDGSVLQLDTDTAVSLPFSRDRRDIELLRGSLSVQVAKDPDHPLRVHCAGVEARAVGTRFVVTRRPGSIEIGVTEGIVAVTSGSDSTAVQLVAGQRAIVDTESHLVRSEALPATSDGWTRGVLSFDREPLRDAVTEVARYLPEHVVFRAQNHATTPVTATFPLDNPQAAIVALARTNGLKITHIPHLLYVVLD